jgi:ABC-type transport system involved in multi-copper enzyme maturation permease subunit
MGWMKMKWSMFYNLQPAWIISRREMRDQIRDWRIVGPMLLLALVFPLVMEYTSSQLISYAGRYGVIIQKDQLIPFLMMVVGFFPVTVSLVLALESFVGEKERNSIEALLSSPLTDKQIYLGKLMASTIHPCSSASWGCRFTWWRSIARGLAARWGCAGANPGFDDLETA